MARHTVRNLPDLARRIATGRGYSVVKAFGTEPIVEATDLSSGASAVTLATYHNSTSPATVDFLGGIIGYAKNSALAKILFGGFAYEGADSVVAGAEGAKNNIFMYRGGGSNGTVVSFKDGFYWGLSALADPGLGKANFIGYMIDGVALPITKTFTSADQLFTAAGALTLAHSLGAVPKLVRASYVNSTAELGYSIGDVVSAYDRSDPGGFGALFSDATNVNVRYVSSFAALAIIHKTTGANTVITPASWRLRIKAYA